MTILNSLIVPKNLKGGTLWDFQTSIMFQNIKKIEGGSLWYNQKIFEKKSHSAKKIQVKNTQIAKVGIFSCFQGSGRRFYNFGWGSKVWGIFWSN